MQAWADQLPLRVRVRRAARHKPGSPPQLHWTAHSLTHSPSDSLPDSESSSRGKRSPRAWARLRDRDVWCRPPPPPAAPGAPATTASAYVRGGVAEAGGPPVWGPGGTAMMIS